MARPTKQGIDYFPIDVDLDQDDKLSMVIAEFGGKGELLFIKLISYIYKNYGYYVVWDEMEQLKFAKRVGYIDGVSANLIKEVVDRCIKWGIFDKSVFDASKILTSARMQRTWLDASRKRKDRQINRAIWIIDGNKAEETKLTAEETPQSIVKYSKPNDTILNQMDSSPVANNPPPEVERPKNAPTLFQVEECFMRLGKAQTEAKRFFDYYEGLNWHKGNTPIVKWQSFANNWQDSNTFQVNNTQQQITSDYATQRQKAEERTRQLSKPD